MQSRLLLRILTAWIGVLIIPLGNAAAQEVQQGRITGMVVNGSDGRRPLEGVEVALRSGRGQALNVIASTTTDARGRFEFADLPTDTGQVFLPGANLHGVHYPGSRFALSFDRAERDVTLVAFESTTAPSPLVVAKHEILVEVGAGFLEVTEHLQVENPSLTTYVGEPADEGPTTTFRQVLPAGLERVTFDREFFALNFLLRDSILATDIPWTPGPRDIKFRYRLPIEPQTADFRRKFELPTSEVRVRVTGMPASEVAANLGARESASEQSVEYRYSGEQLVAGTELVVHLKALPVPWERYARWIGLGVLIVLVVATIGWQRRRKFVEARSATDDSLVRLASGEATCGGSAVEDRPSRKPAKRCA